MIIIRLDFFPVQIVTELQCTKVLVLFSSLLTRNNCSGYLSTETKTLSVYNKKKKRKEHAHLLKELKDPHASGNSTNIDLIHEIKVRCRTQDKGRMNFKVKVATAKEIIAMAMSIYQTVFLVFMAFYGNICAHY